MPGRPPGLEPDDLVNDLLAELLERGRAVQDDLLARTDDELRAAVYNRLRQLAVESAPHWDRYRALKGHVAAVLAEPPRTGPSAAAPTRLTEGRAERLSRDLVRQAVAWLLSTTPTPPRNPATISRLLMRAYFPPDQPAVRERAGPTPRSDRRIQHDGAVLARALKAELPAEELKVLVWTYEGRQLRTIAADLGVAIATAWDLKRRALDTVRAVMATHRIGTGRTVAEALSRLATDVQLKRMLGFYDSVAVGAGRSDWS
jgi:DNA-binding CsgD family transcriptional regulator